MTAKRLDVLVQKRFHVKAPKEKVEHARLRQEYRSQQYQCSRKNLSQLLPQDIEGIIHSVKVDFLSYQEAADKHGVKTSLV